MSRRTRERKRREAEETKKSSYTGSWEFKSIKLALRGAAALFFIAYVIIAAPMSWAWILTTWVRYQPVEEVVNVAEKNLKKNSKPDALRSWIAMRKARDTNAIINLLEPYTPYMSGMTFILFSDWRLAQGNLSEALFWRQYARYRIRYDALRCGASDAAKIITEILNGIPRKQLTAYLDEDPERGIKSIQEVLDYDLKFLPRNDPTDFCKSMNAPEEAKKHIHRVMVDPKDWDGIHAMLRYATYIEVRQMEQEIQDIRNGKSETPPAETHGPDDKKGAQKPEEKRKKHKP